MMPGCKIMQPCVGALHVVGGGLAVAAGVGASATGAGAIVGVPTAIGGGALAVKGADDFWAGLQTVWTGNITDTYLDKAVAGAGTALGASEGTISVLQGVAGAVGNPANIAKEDGERIVREGTEAATERTIKEAAEASAERTARVTGSCYSKALAAMIVARARGVKYVGGPHGTQTNGDASGPVGDGLYSNHMPPNSINRLPDSRGPAIQIEPADHAQTASNGRNTGSRAYIASQGSLIRGGRVGFMQALARDIADVKAIATRQGDPKRYDVAIGMMLAYAACLAASGELD